MFQPFIIISFVIVNYKKGFTSSKVYNINLWGGHIGFYQKQIFAHIEFLISWVIKAKTLLKLINCLVNNSKGRSHRKRCIMETSRKAISSKGNGNIKKSIKHLFFLWAFSLRLS